MSSVFSHAPVETEGSEFLVPNPERAACNGHGVLVALPGMLDWTTEGLSWPLSFSHDIMELLMETKHTSFTTFFEDYIQTWSMFATSSY